VEPLRTHLDFETRSLEDIRLGEHAYAQHFSTAPLMLSFGTAPRGVRPVFDLIDFFEVPGYAKSVYPANPHPQWTIFKVPCPDAIIAAIARGDVFVAHNARFEQAIYYYICHLKWGWPLPVHWSCTAARARYHGLRASLDGAASDLEVIAQKDARGKEFINNFCKPRKYNGPKRDGIVKELWYEPWENPEGWQAGKEYCITDGEAEADVDAVLPDLPPFEQAVWEWDFKLNTRGVPIDIPSVQRAIQFSDYYTAQAVARFEEITALRPTQRDKVLEYLQQRDEINDLGDLRSKTLTRLTLSEFPPDLQDVIQIRLDCSLASIKKLEKMIVCSDSDNRSRGIHLYGGAHTMRWSHKRIQTGNFKRGDPKIQRVMFEYLEHMCWEALQPSWVQEAGMRFFRPLTNLSHSMRGFVKAPKGKKIVAADFAQIEARVLAWLARCMWLLQAFRDKQDPYVKFGAEYMYGRDYDSCFEMVKGERKVRLDFKRERQIAKSAVLGAGFGLGKRKFVEYCDNSNLIISEDEADRTITAYRDAHPEIVALWGRVEAAAILATSNPGVEYELGGTGVSFRIWGVDSERFWLVCQLPSGRAIHYYRPKVGLKHKWGRVVEGLSFRTEWNGKTYREDTYGGKMVENIVQAIARDILCVGGLKAEAAGYPTIMLVHDENVTLPDIDFGSHQELCEIMCDQEPWITDLPVEAEGATMQRYGK
jgi:DNA polymerase bacteriophage-type